MEHADKTDQFLEHLNLPKLTQKEKEILNRPLTTKGIEAAVKTLPTTKKMNKGQKLAGSRIFQLLCGLQVGEEILIPSALAVSM